MAVPEGQKKTGPEPWLRTRFRVVWSEALRRDAGVFPGYPDHVQELELPAWSYRETKDYAY